MNTSSIACALDFIFESKPSRLTTRGFQSPVRHPLIMQLNKAHRKPHLAFYIQGVSVAYY